MKRKKTACITGANGFVAGHLSRLLQSHHFFVSGIDLQDSPIHSLNHYSRLDLLDTPGLVRYLKHIRPDHIYHLGAMSLPVDAEETPIRALQINILGSVSLLDAIRKSSPQSKVLLVGSSKEYGTSLKTGRTIRESAPLSPNCFYGISKASMEMIGMEYGKKFSLHICCTRSFNHAGPGQSAKFVCSDWARQVAEIELERSSSSKMYVGRLNEEIDFLDVRDVARAYYAILSKGKKENTYNVCSGKTYSLKHILNELCSKSNKDIKIIRSSEKKKGHSGFSKLKGSYRKVYTHTGWKPLIPFSETLEDTYRYWYNLLKSG